MRGCANPVGTSCKMPVAMETTLSRHYHLRKEALAVEEHRAVRSYIPALVMVLAIGLLVSTLVSMRNGASTNVVVGFGIFIALYVTYCAFAIPRRVRRRLSKLWETYELEVGSD